MTWKGKKRAEPRAPPAFPGVIGRLDVVFANAGVAMYAPFGTITEQNYNSIFGVNVKGLLFTVQKALPLLPDGASIILNASAQPDFLA